MNTDTPTLAVSTKAGSTFDRLYTVKRVLKDKTVNSIMENTIHKQVAPDTPFPMLLVSFTPSRGVNPVEVWSQFLLAASAFQKSSFAQFTLNFSIAEIEGEVMEKVKRKGARSGFEIGTYRN